MVKYQTVLILFFVPATMIFLYLMECNLQKKMIATLCKSFNALCAFKIRYHLQNCHLFVY